MASELERMANMLIGEIRAAGPQYGIIRAYIDKAHRVGQEEMRETLEAIRDYGIHEGDGYPVEVVFDEFAYKRMVDSYRKAASDALARIGQGGPDHE